MSPETLSSTILTGRSTLQSHLFMDSKRLHVVTISIPPLLRIPPFVHSHQIELLSLIHTINNTNSTPLRNGSIGNINMKMQQWNRKRVDCWRQFQFMDSNEELDKWHNVDSYSPITRLPYEQPTHWIFVFPFILIHLGRFLVMTNTIHANQMKWMKRQVSFMRIPSE